MGIYFYRQIDKSIPIKLLVLMISLCISYQIKSAEAQDKSAKAETNERNKVNQLVHYVTQLNMIKSKKSIHGEDDNEWSIIASSIGCLSMSEKLKKQYEFYLDSEFEKEKKRINSTMKNKGLRYMEKMVAKEKMKQLMQRARFESTIKQNKQIALTTIAKISLENKYLVENNKYSYFSKQGIFYDKSTTGDSEQSLIYYLGDSTSINSKGISILVFIKNLCDKYNFKQDYYISKPQKSEKLSAVIVLNDNVKFNIDNNTKIEEIIEEIILKLVPEKGKTANSNIENKK